MSKFLPLHKHTSTLEFGIDVRQGINVGPGKFGNKDKRRALIKLENIHSPWKKFQNLLKVGPLIRL